MCTGQNIFTINQSSIDNNDNYMSIFPHKIMFFSYSQIVNMARLFKNWIEF